MNDVVWADCAQTDSNILIRRTTDKLCSRSGQCSRSLYGLRLPSTMTHNRDDNDCLDHRKAWCAH